MHRKEIDNSRFDVAIVGGGFAGATLAAQFLRQNDASFSVVVIERAPVRARGIAYGTQEPRHLLNVPAWNMSALANDPQHFLRWARSNFDSGAQAGDFLPRRVYGQYVESVLDDAIRTNPGRFTWKQGHAVALHTHEFGSEIVLRSGEKILADAVVLALGNFPPANLALPGKPDQSRFYVPDPWSPDAFERMPSNGTILLVGSGLTSVDTLLTLRARGFRGNVHMLSRHGLLPQIHLAKSDCSGPWNNEFPCTARDLTRLLRERVREAGLRGEDWRSIIDSLRPATQQIWQSLSRSERKRFYRHLRAYWEVHRHRIAPELGKVIEHQLNIGQLRVHAGRIVEYKENPNGVAVTWRDRRSGKPDQLAFDLVVNCTGPTSDIRKAGSPLLADCLRQGLVRPDGLSLGIDCTNDGAVIDADGIASEALYVVGPLRKGNLWETIAVPEIRTQVAELASLLANKHDSPRSRRPSLTESATYA